MLDQMSMSKGIDLGEIAALTDLKIHRVHHEQWLSNRILHPRAQRPGLALTGYFEYLNKDRIQIFGKTEMGYLHHLPLRARRSALIRYMRSQISGILVSESLDIDANFIRLAGKGKTPILVSELRTSLLISRISSFLYQYFSRKIKINGTLLDIMGQGVMVTGASGIGKSETALALINKGHHLIADDVIEFYLNSNDDPVGKASERIQSLLEVRGLGIIHVDHVFGASAVLPEKKLDLIIHLERWDAKKMYDRLGEENQYDKILDIDIPMFTLPVAPGRDLSTLIEVAVRYFISRQNGNKSFLEEYDEEMKRKAAMEGAVP